LPCDHGDQLLSLIGVNRRIHIRPYLLFRACVLAVGV
jgi:hypothetical protein